MVFYIMQNISDINFDADLKPTMIKLEDDVNPKSIRETGHVKTMSIISNDENSSVVVKEEIEIEETSSLHDIKTEIHETEVIGMMDCIAKQEPNCSTEPEHKGMGLRVCSFAKDIQNTGQLSSSNEPLGSNFSNQNPAQGTCLVLPNLMLAPNNLYYMQGANPLSQVFFALGNCTLTSLTIPVVQMPTDNIGVNTVQPNVQQNTFLINQPTCGENIAIENKPKQFPAVRKITPKLAKNEIGALKVDSVATIEEANDPLDMEGDLVIVDEIVESKSNWTRLKNAKSSLQFRCDICWFETKYKWVFDTHASEHLTFNTVKESVVVQYKCPKCTQTFRTIIKVFFHIKKRHQSTQLACQMFNCKIISGKKRLHVCKPLTLLSSKLVIQVSHKGCRFCKRIIKYGLKRHILIMHKYMKLYLCNQCSFDTPDELLFLRHKVWHQLGMPIKLKLKHQCPFCSKQMQSKETFNRHVANCKNSKCIDYYRCRKCSFYSNSMFKLHIHSVNEHLENRMLVCKICSFKTRRLRILSRHVLTHFTQARTVKCNRCFFQSEHPRLLKFHSSNHTDDNAKMAVCKFCFHRAPDVAKLNEHVRDKHFYTCKNCSWRTNKRKRFWKHRCELNVKAVPKIYRCNCCFITSSKKVYYKHVKRHKRMTRLKWLNRWSFRCRLCSFVASCKFNYVEHVSGHVLDKAHFCQICTYKIVKLGNL